MLRRNLTRRRFLATTASSSALVAMPHVRSANAAGRLSVQLWDHWVPGANSAVSELIEEWAAREKVEIRIDHALGPKLLLTAAAESQARSGHDIITLLAWQPAEHAKSLEPVDDVMGPLINLNGPVTSTVEYLGRSEGHWSAVPATAGTQIQGPCSRIDLLKEYAGIDVQAMYPAGSAPKADNWTLEAFLRAAKDLPTPGSRSASGSAPRTIQAAPPARSSTRSAPHWSTPRVTSRSSQTRCARRSTTT